ncbi:MAG: hypothetical protein ACOZIN_10595 [Myxococcota bacterium]
MSIPLETVVRWSALAACTAVLAMIGIFLALGVGQDPLQFMHPPEEYARLLLANPAALRATIGLDNMFVVLYATLFLAVGTLLARAGAPLGLVWVAVGLLEAVALLDFAENFHFLVMLARAEQGQLPAQAEIGLQVFESLLKFHVSYLGLFLLGLALPRRTLRERALSNLALFVQVPVGVSIYVMPRAVAEPLVFARFTFFVASLVLIAGIFGRARQEQPALAAAGSDARA